MQIADKALTRTKATPDAIPLWPSRRQWLAWLLSIPAIVSAITLVPRLVRDESMKAFQSSHDFKLRVQFATTAKLLSGAMYTWGLYFSRSTSFQF